MSPGRKTAEIQAKASFRLLRISCKTGWRLDFLELVPRTGMDCNGSLRMAGWREKFKRSPKKACIARRCRLSVMQACTPKSGDW